MGEVETVEFRLNEERALHAKQENEYQQTISCLQKKIADMIKQHTKAMDEIKRDLNQERLAAQKHLVNRPICVPEYVQVCTLPFALPPSPSMSFLDRSPAGRRGQIRLHGNSRETPR